MTEPAMRERAVALAKLGLRVFRLRPNSKLPAAERFYEQASADPETVARMWTEPVTGESSDHNIGVLTGEGLLVLDIDDKNGRRGSASLQDLIDNTGLDTETLTALTPSGGRHLFYRVPPGADVRSSVNRLGQGIDVRGYHGYVAGVGSIVPEGEYDWSEAGAVIADPPDWLIRLCGPKHKGGDLDPAAPLDLDEADAARRAREWLETAAPEAVEGQGGNETTYRVACRVKDFGVPEPIALDLLLDHWNTAKAVPPWSPEELERLVSNAYRYGTAPVGAASAQAEFSAIDLPSNVLETDPNRGKTEHAARKRLFIVRPEESVDLALRQQVDPLIKGLLDRGALSSIYGDSNTGKTFVALDMALHVAAGKPWNGRKTAHGLVAYVAAEGGGGAHKRIRAWHDRHKADPGQSRFALIPCPIDLRSAEGDAKALLDLIREEERRRGESTTLLVIDTLSRALAGGDENSSVDMGGFVKNIDRLRAALSAHVLLVHHTGKDAARGMRGWSGMRAAIDTEMEVADRTLSVTKQRDLEPIAGIKFRLEPCRVGADADGEPITTCTVRLLAADEFDAVPLTPAEEALLGCIRETVGRLAEAAGIELDTYVFGQQAVSEAASLSAFSSRHSSARQTVLGHLSALSEKGAVKKVQRGQWVMANVGIVGNCRN